MSIPITKEEEEEQKLTRMSMIYKALEDGWSVRKTDNTDKTFEFTKYKSLENDYKGLVVFGRNNNSFTQVNNICDDIQKHLENKIKTNINIKKTDSKRSVSTPVTKTN
jgi:archaellum component FlaF (FlaF/FlaG flagellin family)